MVLWNNAPDFSFYVGGSFLATGRPEESKAWHVLWDKPKD